MFSANGFLAVLVDTIVDFIIGLVGGAVTGFFSDLFFGGGGDPLLG